MKNLKQKLLVATIASVVSIGMSAEDIRLPEPFALPTVSNPASPLLNTNRQATYFSWKVNDSFVPAPNNVAASTNESTEYWQTVTGAQLNKGLNISTSAPGALVRISQKGNKSSASYQKVTGVNPLDLNITANGKKFANGTAMSMKASPQAMRDAGSPFPDGTAAFKFKDSLGAGNFTLQNQKAVNPSNEYVLHVFDKASTQRLSVTRDQASYKAGDTLALHGDLTDNYKGMNIADVSGFVRTPSGKTLPLIMKKGVNGQFRAALPLKGQAEFGALYEAYIDASSFKNGIETKRRVKTAFAVTNPTASMKAVSGTLEFGLPVNVLAKDAGRYEVRGVLYGTNDAGAMIPFMASSSAQWLNRGNRNMTLKFDPSILSSSGMNAPFEVRHLQLFDQSRMGNLQVMDKAIGITGNVRPPVIAPTPTLPTRPVTEPRLLPRSLPKVDVVAPQEATRDERISQYLQYR